MLHWSVSMSVPCWSIGYAEQMYSVRPSSYTDRINTRLSQRLYYCSERILIRVRPISLYQYCRVWPIWSYRYRYAYYLSCRYRYRYRLIKPISILIPDIGICMIRLNRYWYINFGSFLFHLPLYIPTLGCYIFISNRYRYVFQNS